MVRAPRRKPFDQQFFGAGIVGHPLLRKHAEFDIDRPGIVARQLLDRLKSDQSDAGVQFDMGPHPHRAMRNATLQRLSASRIDVLDGEAALGRRGFANGLGDRALLETATIKDAGLVEMNMRFDQAGNDEAAFRLQFGAIGRQRRRNGCDPLALDGNIDIDEFAIAQDARVPDNQIHQFITFTKQNPDKRRRAWRHAVPPGFLAPPHGRRRARSRGQQSPAHNLPSGPRSARSCLHLAAV